MNFADLKNNADELTKKLTDSLQNEGGKSRDTDDRFWYPGVDKAGNGTATIRFLPTPPADGADGQPYVKLISYRFKGPTGRWYFENSPTTLSYDRKDPVAEYNKQLWNSGSEADKAIARRQKQSKKYYFNVYIISDEINPENEGKVKILQAGPMWYNFIKNAMVPEFDDETPIDVFNLWKGANFKVRIKTEAKAGEEKPRRNYDRSSFDAPSQLFEDESKMEEIWKQSHSLQAFIAEDQFKSYDELCEKFTAAIGSSPSNPTQHVAKEDISAKEESQPAKQVEEDVVTNTLEEDDEDLKFFADLASQD